MIFTSPQGYYIKQLLTIDHDCPVPVDKHGSVKILPHPFDHTYGWVKYLNFAITKVVVNTFAEILNADKGAIYIWNISNGILLWRPASDPLGWTKGWGRGQK